MCTAGVTTRWLCRLSRRSREGSREHLGADVRVCGWRADVRRRHECDGVTLITLVKSWGGLVVEHGSDANTALGSRLRSLDERLRHSRGLAHRAACVVSLPSNPTP